MAQATPSVPEPTQKISVHAVNVLARLAAQRQIKAQLAGEGVRVSMVRHSEIMERANALLSANPRLYIEARALAERLGMYQRPSRRRLSVRRTEDAKSPTENNEENPTEEPAIKGCRLLNAH
jgi:hypothetical protein